MSNEKWILYYNVEQKRSWDKRREPSPTTPKPSLHPKKAMLCIWWNWKGVLYYELLLESQRINSNRYCSQLDQLKAVLDKKCQEWVNRKCIIFHQGYAQLHVSLMNRQKLLQLSWDVLIHPLYSSNIVTLDFNLFQSSQNSLNRKSFSFLEDCKRHQEEFLAQNDKKFWKTQLWSCLKNGKREWKKRWNCYSVKFLVQMKNVSFIFI